MFLLVFAVFLPMVAIFTWHVVLEIQDARHGAYARVKQLADETAANIQAILEDNELVLSRLAARPLIQALDPKRCDSILTDYVSLHPEFSTLALRDANANIVCTLLANPPFADQTRRLSWFQESIRSDGFTVGDALLSARSKRWVTVSAFPVRDKAMGNTGVVFFSVDLLKLNQKIFRSVPKGAVVAVTDRNDSFLLRSIDPDKWIGRPLPADNAARVRGQQEGYFTRIGADDGAKRLYAFVTIPRTGWRVFAGLPEEEVFAEARTRILISVLVGVTILMLVLALAYRISMTIVRPVGDLAQAAANISAGEGSARANVSGPAEIAKVAVQFNHMLDVREQAEAAHEALEAQLRESQKMEAIGTLAGGIAHDFNNALATILGNVELARQDVSTNEIAMESLEEIHKAGSRARNLVQQILSFSRRRPTERKPVALAAIVEETARMLRATMPGNIELIVQCDNDVPLVLADTTQIQQVLINVATNAMQSMHGAPGRIGIQLATHRVDEPLHVEHERRQSGSHVFLRPGIYARLIVQDNGPGMSEATRARIFEPFFTTKPVGLPVRWALACVRVCVRERVCACAGAVEGGV
ncbi:MAG: cache domain-containing protein [Proteobacteria bacterium]|nr:cache domain-containing protein [Pseudomonadota bacterium]